MPQALLLILLGFETTKTASVLCSLTVKTDCEFSFAILLIAKEPFFRNKSLFGNEESQNVHYVENGHAMKWHL